MIVSGMSAHPPTRPTLPTRPAETDEPPATDEPAETDEPPATDGLPATDEPAEADGLPATYEPPATDEPPATAEAAATAGDAGTAASPGTHRTGGTSGTPKGDRTAGAAVTDGTGRTAAIAGTAATAGAAGIAASPGTHRTGGTSGTPKGDRTAGAAVTDGTGRTAAIAGTAGTAGTAATVATAGTAEATETTDTAATAGSDEAAEVRRFWQDLGLPGLVDVHTHFMPERVLHKVWAYFDGLGPLTGGIEWPITYREEEAERAALLRAFGVRAFTAMLYPHKPGMARWLNGWAAGFARRTPDCLHTSTLFPEPGAAAYVREALEHGTRVFKAHVQVGGYDPADEALDACWGLLAEAGTPVVVHCGSGPAPGRHTGPGPMARVLARHPRLRLIVAHLGMPEYEDFLDLAERYAEVRLDTTMAFTGFSERMAPFPRRALPRLAALGDRVLLGTDFPNIPYPYAHQLDALAELALGDDWLRAVCHDNAARLFRLPHTPEPPP
ncbi:hypothetical protein GCM10010478_43830 [Streptomyces erythrogriseus]|uniref:Amidohydrolase-related domain-containing protein n=1 Tax=Streptomyces erythrogriseus TaxID=284027 RepID=A0ABN3X6W6_9ACTN